LAGFAAGVADGERAREQEDGDCHDRHDLRHGYV
jgi:hypothetical protein